jgi:hypothetical protein
VAVRRAHHGDLDALVAQSGDAPGPVSFDHGSPFEFEAQLGEKRDSGIKRFHHDADVVHPLKRHAAILADRKKITSVREARGIRCPCLWLCQRSRMSPEPAPQARGGVAYFRSIAL